MPKKNAPPTLMYETAVLSELRITHQPVIGQLLNRTDQSGTDDNNSQESERSVPSSEPNDATDELNTVKATAPTVPIPRRRGASFLSRKESLDARPGRLGGSQKTTFHVGSQASAPREIPPKNDAPQYKTAHSYDGHSATGQLPGLAEFRATRLEIEANLTAPIPEQHQKLPKGRHPLSNSSHSSSNLSSATDSGAATKRGSDYSILGKLRRYKSAHSDGAALQSDTVSDRSVDVFSDASSTDSNDTQLPERRPSRLRRYKSANAESTFAFKKNRFFHLGLESIKTTLRPDSEALAGSLDNQTLKCIEKELYSINTRLLDYHLLKVEKKSFSHGLKTVTDDWNNEAIVNLSNILKSAKQPIAACLDQRIDDDAKAMFEDQKINLGEEILRLFGETEIKYNKDTNRLIGTKRYTFVDWKGGMNNCLAILEDRETSTDFVLKGAEIACNSILNQTSFLHAYAKGLSDQATPGQLVSDIYEFIFVNDIDNFIPTYDNCGGFGQVIQIAAYYKNCVDLKTKYNFNKTEEPDAVAMATRAAPSISNNDQKANRIYHAVRDWHVISKGLLKLFEKGIYFTDIKGANFMENPQNNSPMIVDFKTAFVANSDRPNIIRKIADIELSPGYYYQGSIREDNTIPVIYVICQAILISCYESITGIRSNDRAQYMGEKKCQFLDLNSLWAMYGEEIPCLPSFFIRWETILSPEEPTYPDDVYLKILMKDFERLAQRLMLQISRTNQNNAPIEFDDIESFAQENADDNNTNVKAVIHP